MPTAAYGPQAIQLPPNYVWRSYAGGSVLRRFRGRGGADDDHFPEDWLASTVRARNGVYSQGADEGLSRVRDALLSDVLTRESEFWLGVTTPVCHGTGVLWKLLDAAVRLQLQAHPDAAFARRHLNSNAGKKECWYILATRGDAHVYLGFQKSPDRAEWGRMIREQRTDEMLACFEKIPVHAGECFVVPAGTPHAIGAGVFMMELQEPTDWVVRCEMTNAGLRLPESACFMGLDLETCLDVFDYESITVAEVRRRWQQRPRLLNSGSGFCEEEVIAPEHHHFFRLNRLRGVGNATWSGGELTLLVALKGDGRLMAANGKELAVQAGETWLLPGCAAEWNWTSSGNDWEFLLAKPPLPETMPASHNP